MRTEQEFFAAYISDFAKVKAFVFVRLIEAFPQFATAAHRSEIVASIAASQPSFLQSVITELNKGDVPAATAVVAEAITAAQSADPYLFATQPSKDEIAALYFEMQDEGLLNKHGSATENRANVLATVDRLDLDKGRRTAYDFRHRLAAAKAA